jgi:murein DD-endopeptidase MepM/ murein hydrolase activator NlpD
MLLVPCLLACSSPRPQHETRDASEPREVGDAGSVWHDAALAHQDASLRDAAAEPRMAGAASRRDAALDDAAALPVLDSGAADAAVPAIAAGSDRFTWPLSGSSTADELNSPFGPRLRASMSYAYEFHPGVDIAAPVGTAVFAVAAGSVRLLTDDAGCRIDHANETAPAGCTPVYPSGGRIVQLDHGAELYSNYLHLSQQQDGLTTGASVAQREQVGATGTSGETTFEHLHFEFREGSYYSADVKNPLGYLPWSGDRPTRIADVRAASGAAGLEVALDAPAQDLDLDRVQLRVFDTAGNEVYTGEVAFDDKVNCGDDTQTVSGITLLPEKFSIRSPAYGLTVSFDEAPRPPGGSVEAVAQDVSGQRATKTSALP